MDQKPGFGIVLFISVKGREHDEIAEWYARFLERTFPVVDGAIDVRLLENPETVVTLQRWRDRESYEAYRHGAGMESAQRILPLQQHVEHCLPIAAFGDPSDAAAHFLVRFSAGESSEKAALRFRDGVAHLSTAANGFAGAQVYLDELGTEVFGLLSWRADADFGKWRLSQAGKAGAAWLREYQPRVWKLAQVDRVLGLAYV